jgi:RNA polymerase sigma factor (sigma-70 family)
MQGNHENGHAIESLLQRHLEDLRVYVRRNMDAELGQRESAADIVQSICREVLQSQAQYVHRGDAAFRQWLLQVALRKLIDRRRFYRARKRDAVKLEQPGSSTSFDLGDLARLAGSLKSPSGEAMLREELGRLAAALEQLGENDRAIIRMIHLDGMTHAEVGERIGCTEGQSRGRLFLALARLSAFLRPGPQEKS